MHTPLSYKLKKIAIAHRLTLDKLAELMGVSVHMVQDVFRGRRLISQPKLNKLAKELGIPLHYMQIERKEVYRMQNLRAYNIGMHIIKNNLTIKDYAHDFKHLCESSKLYNKLNIDVNKTNIYSHTGTFKKKKQKQKKGN